MQRRRMCHNVELEAEHQVDFVTHRHSRPAAGLIDLTSLLLREYKSKAGVKFGRESGQ